MNPFKFPLLVVTSMLLSIIPAMADTVTKLECTVESSCPRHALCTSLQFEIELVDGKYKSIRAQPHFQQTELRGTSYDPETDAVSVIGSSTGERLFLARIEIGRGRGKISYADGSRDRIDCE